MSEAVKKFKHDGGPCPWCGRQGKKTDRKEDHSSGPQVSSSVVFSGKIQLKGECDLQNDRVIVLLFCNSCDNQIQT